MFALRALAPGAPDVGATWRFDPLDVGGSWEGVAAMDVDRRGVVRVHSRWGDCANEGSTLTRHDPATGTSTSAEIAVYPQGSSALDGDGRVLGVTAGDDLVRWSPRFGVRYLAGDVID